MKRQDLLAALLLAMALPGPVSPAYAETAPAAAPLPGDTDESRRAEALLGRAVTHLRSHGGKALADFSVSGHFVDGDLYVYVLDTQGVLQASGGASFHMIGRNVLEYRDPDGKSLFAEILAGARKDGRGLIHYRWLNPQRGTVERKAAYYQAVNDYIAAVGYYAPRATPEQALSVLWRAVDELQRRGTAAFDAFNDLNGGFVRDDTYVFVVGIKDQRMHAHGANPRLVGRKVAELKDAAGKPIIEEMLRIVVQADEGSLEYQWRNPATGAIENKRTFLRRIGDYMVGVGYYQP
ncbi:hypothetical protein M622_13500 [Thauera terpenica 58Eu]|uniref:Single Cache domain-containing protein n=1 Tax=Thauera terpenica 58Eu TaxID=1348657 RepID=T0B087_9RHOO|nr:cache domain-containing protein [Thauera terpenica]EPZ16238.1 hypothetical protein M622_13500 [Thauera terpenica 58Eu]